MVNVQEFSSYISSELQVDDFKDYGPNGLQVSGREYIKKLVTGVSINEELIDRAIDCNADTILAHHGIIWYKESPEITGVKKNRLAKILQNEINIFAYHLPLDVHHTFGNNHLLGKAMGWQTEKKMSFFGVRDLINFGFLLAPKAIEDIIESTQDVFGQDPIFVPAKDRNIISSVAWCTGACQDGIEVAAQNGADLFVTGEISERTYHLAKELNINFLAVGHHASETFGVEELGAHLAEKFSLEYEFINVYNPI